jgi:L-lactate dehydrogenase complex protein LldG
MAPDLLETFESALDGLGVTHERTTAADLPETVTGAVSKPAVGAELPWEELSLDDTPVDQSPTPAALQSAATGVTAAGAGIANSGSLIVQSRPGGDEPVSLYPPLHVAVVRASDLVETVSDSMAWLAKEFDAGRRSAVLTTGPSATADMGELITGVHGPGAVHVVSVTDA